MTASSSSSSDASNRRKANNNSLEQQSCVAAAAQDDSLHCWQQQKGDEDDQTNQYPTLFYRDGYLRLYACFSPTLIQQWANVYGTDAFFNMIFQTLHERGHTPFSTHRNQHTGVYALGRGITHGFKEIVMRSPGRYEIAVSDETIQNEMRMAVQNALPFLPLLFQAPATEQSPLSWNDIRCISTTLVISTPGAVDQGWHADGGHVVHEHHAPCHCLNICIPLSPSHHTAEHGPTQLRPGSHYWTRAPSLAHALLLATAKKKKAPPVQPSMQHGDALMFDYRILHRGRANTTTTTNRVLLVMTWAVEGFEDKLNFPQNSMGDVKM